MPLETARAIGKLGFRRWYERQLIESHLWLVTALLCGFTIVAFLEATDFGDPGTAALGSVFVFVAGLVCWHGLRRFLLLMQQAQRLASQTNCPRCQAYARFEILDQNARMRVRCRGCAHEWVIN